MNPPFNLPLLFKYELGKLNLFLVFLIVNPIILFNLFLVFFIISLTYFFLLLIPFICFSLNLFLVFFIISLTCFFLLLIQLLSQLIDTLLVFLIILLHLIFVFLSVLLRFFLVFLSVFLCFLVEFLPVFLSVFPHLFFSFFRRFRHFILSQLPWISLKNRDPFWTKLLLLILWNQKFTIVSFNPLLPFETRIAYRFATAFSFTRFIITMTALSLPFSQGSVRCSFVGFLVSGAFAWQWRLA